MQPALRSIDMPAKSQLTGYEPKTRDDLLMLATSRFCAADRHTRLSTEQYKEAFYLLIDEVGPETRMRISRKLAECHYTPRALAIYLAMDELEIARPILTLSPVLGQLDLLQIVDVKPLVYSVIIAKRPDIGPSLIRRLQRIGSEEITRALQQNYALLDTTHRKDADSLFAVIDTRKDTADSPGASDISSEMLTPAQPDNQNRKEAAPLYQPTAHQPQIQQQQVQQKRSAAEEALLTAAARGGRMEPLAVPSTRPAEPVQIDPDFDLGRALERAAQTRSRQAMAVLMQKYGGFSLSTAFQVLEDQDGDTLAVFMRAMGIGDAQANRIQLLTHPNIGLSVHNAMRAVRFYSKLQTESCKEAIRLWPKEQASHQPLHEDGTPVRRDVGVAAVKAVEWASGREHRLAG